MLGSLFILHFLLNPAFFVKVVNNISCLMVKSPGSFPTKVALLGNSSGMPGSGSRPNSKLTSTRLRPVTRELVHEKKGSTVHKPMFRPDNRLRNSMLKQAYPSGFMRKLVKKDKGLREVGAGATDSSEMMRRMVSCGDLSEEVLLSLGKRHDDGGADQQQCGQEYGLGHVASSSNVLTSDVVFGAGGSSEEGSTNLSYMDVFTSGYLPEQNSSNHPNRSDHASGSAGMVKGDPIEPEALLSAGAQYKAHMMAMIAKYQESLNAQMSLKPQDFEKASITCKVFDGGIPLSRDLQETQAKRAQLVRTHREILVQNKRRGSSVLNLENYSVGGGNVGQGSNSIITLNTGDFVYENNASCDAEAGNVSLRKNSEAEAAEAGNDEERRRLNSAPGLDQPGRDASMAEGSSISVLSGSVATATPAFAPPAPPLKAGPVGNEDLKGDGDGEATNDRAPFDQVERDNGEECLMIYILSPGELTSIAKGGERGSLGFEAVKASTKRASTKLIKVGLKMSYGEFLETLMSSLRYPRGTSVKLECYNVFKNNWEDLKNEIDWRDCFNIAKLQQRKMFLLSTPLILSEDEAMDRREAEERRDGNNKTKSAEGHGEHFPAIFPSKAMTIPNHLLERDNDMENFYKEKLAEWDSAVSKSSRRKKTLEGRSLESSVSMSTLDSSAGMGLVGEYARLLGRGGRERAWEKEVKAERKTCLLNTVMGAEVRGIQSLDKNVERVKASRRKLYSAIERSLKLSRPAKISQYR